MIIELGDGKQIVVTADKRSGGVIWLQLCANGGSLGVQLDKKSVVRIRSALFSAIIESGRCL